MLEILFIYALELGITGSPTNEVEPIVYAQAEAGWQMEDLYFLVYFNGNYDHDSTATFLQRLDEKKAGVMLYAEPGIGSFGCIYEIDLQTGVDSFTIWGRVQSWGKK